VGYFDPYDPFEGRVLEMWEVEIILLDCKVKLNKGDLDDFMDYIDRTRDAKTIKFKDLIDDLASDLKKLDIGKIPIESVYITKKLPQDARDLLTQLDKAARIKKINVFDDFDNKRHGSLTFKEFLAGLDYWNIKAID
jgi:hypothetical protein